MSIEISKPKDRSLKQVVSDLSADASLLVRQEIALDRGIGSRLTPGPCGPSWRRGGWCPPRRSPGGWPRSRF